MAYLPKQELEQKSQLKKCRTTHFGGKKNNDRIHIVFLGDKNTGKTTLIDAYQNNGLNFEQNNLSSRRATTTMRATIGMDLKQVLYKRNAIAIAIAKGENQLAPIIEYVITEGAETPENGNYDHSTTNLSEKKNQLKRQNSKKNGIGSKKGNKQEDNSQKVIKTKNSIDIEDNSRNLVVDQHKNNCHTSRNVSPNMTLKNVSKSDLSNKYSDQSSTTATDESMNRKQNVKKEQQSTEYKINMWDTQGMERCNSIPASQIKKADAIILLFDLTDRATFEQINGWLDKIADVAQEGVPVFVVGNKTDLRNLIQISEQEQIQLQKARSVQGIRVSAKSDAKHINQFLEGVFNEAIDFKLRKMRVEVVRDFVAFKGYAATTTYSINPQGCLLIENYVKQNFKEGLNSQQAVLRYNNDCDNNKFVQQIIEMEDPLRSSIKLSARNHSFLENKKRKSNKDKNCKC